MSLSFSVLIANTPFSTLTDFPLFFFTFSVRNSEHFTFTTAPSSIISEYQYFTFTLINDCYRPFPILSDYPFFSLSRSEIEDTFPFQNISISLSVMISDLYKQNLNWLMFYTLWPLSVKILALHFHCRLERVDLTSLCGISYQIITMKSICNERHEWERARIYTWW